MSVGQTQIRFRGKDVDVPSVLIDGRTLISTGNWLQLAAFQDEELVEGEVLVGGPEMFISQLQASGLRADIFTFAQKIPHVQPMYKYHLEWDSLAAIPITNYADWFDKRIESDVRAAIKKSARLGVLVRQVELDDDFIQGIVRIYNESRYRQGRPFWHFGKDFDAVKQMNSTYPDRSTLIGAYYNDELIGFIKMVRVGTVEATLQVIGMKQYFNKKVTNALIAKAVEICAKRGRTHLVYGNFVYKDPSSSLTEFKRRNGFEEILLPRYYIPLTAKGKVALRLRLHKGISEAMPLGVWRAMSKLRSVALEYRSSRSD